MNKEICPQCGGDGWLWHYESEMVPDPRDPTGQTPMEEMVTRREVCYICGGEGLVREDK